MAEKAFTARSADGTVPAGEAAGDEGAPGILFISLFDFRERYRMGLIYPVHDLILRCWRSKIARERSLEGVLQISQ
ncbi:hypothetical protein [Methylobacterium nonmethylotrophicum]|uniref:Uncharacterized protein n=1 Tax=Methylobacterium nonmethylotrophicum TaxID=1141884 RepID=A0A4Z0NUB8_9HYPH|nr:hypothetical protein [Methylobacterium nonmethylotrophicum]TGE01116.1 hypothetical protein EU555_05795 [Methylobacterium nonmethylotrophicum]